MESPLTLRECRVRGTRETQRQASVLERRAVDAPARVRQPNAPLETAVRELEPANGGAARRSREPPDRSEEHTSELQSRRDLVCRLLLEKKKKKKNKPTNRQST